MQVVGRAPLGLGRERPGLRLGQLGEELPVARHAQHREVPDVIEEVPAEALRIVAVGVERGEVAHAGGRIAAKHVVPHRNHQPAVGGAEDLPHRRLVGRRLAGRQHLIEQRLRVPQAAFRLTCDERQRVVGEADAFGAGDLLQLLEQLAEPDAPEVVALAAGEHGGQDLVRVGGGEDELHVRRRLLERLQEGVEGVLREHVHFVDDVDLEAAPDRLVRDRLHEVPHLVDLGVRGAVDLEHVEGTSLADLAAVRALVAGLLANPALAVERLREETRRRRLAHPPRPGEEEGVGDAARGDGGLERARHVLLPDDLVEPLGSETAGEHLVRHRWRARREAPGGGG